MTHSEPARKAVATGLRKIATKREAALLSEEVALVKKAASIIENLPDVAALGPRPCDCTRCDCGNIGDAQEVARWDERAAITAYLQALSPGSTGETERCSPISDEPLEALSHARTTAANDDTSKPGTVERKRHCQRLAAMQSATAEIVKLRALLSAEGLKLGSRLTVDGVEAVVVPKEPGER